MPAMTAEDRKNLAKSLYEELLRQGHSPEAARALLAERHGLTEEQLDSFSPRPKRSYPKPQPPTRQAMEAELQTAAGFLRSLVSQLQARGGMAPDESRRAAKMAEHRARRIEALLTPAATPAHKRA